MKTLQEKASWLFWNGYDYGALLSYACNWELSVDDTINKLYSIKHDHNGD